MRSWIIKLCWCMFKDKHVKNTHINAIMDRLLVIGPMWTEKSECTANIRCVCVCFSPHFHAVHVLGAQNSIFFFIRSKHSQKIFIGDKKKSNRIYHQPNGIDKKWNMPHYQTTFTVRQPNSSSAGWKNSLFIWCVFVFLSIYRGGFSLSILMLTTEKKEHTHNCCCCVDFSFIGVIFNSY